MNMKKYVVIGMAALLMIGSCKEENRFASHVTDGVPPGKITIVNQKPLYGGARFFYNLPADEDLLQVEAVYVGKNEKSYTFSASYFVDSLDVYGFGSTDPHEVTLYTVDRSGNRSEPVVVSVTPLEPAFSRVASSIEVKSGFSSFFLDWKNELEQNVNVYVDYNFTLNGEQRQLTTVFSSNLAEDRRFINDLFLSPQDQVRVSVRVEDQFGNITDPIDKGALSLYEDIEIPKTSWILPDANDSIGGVPMCFGDGLEGRSAKVIDGIIDRGDNLNFMHTHSRGRTGRTADGNMPWNFIIDLGDYYELSRIVTVQRHSGGLSNINRGQYYQSENVGMYNMYVWDDDTQEWVFISQHKIPVPVGLSELEFVQAGEAGDEAYMYPNDPQYTKPTRWFRYEAIKSFNGNYTLEDANCLSEITLYGRRAD
ncbi:DUF4959 domain-containing protein [Parapedobacter sp. GCM10030251]|uniref:DUF4959 domain-containing protein n=1 Tax=Parapedobacter sp. GCM10030251 TaxID=3273419 RepID=UPI003606DF27